MNALWKVEQRHRCTATGNEDESAQWVVVRAVTTRGAALVLSRCDVHPSPRPRDSAHDSVGLAVWHLPLAGRFFKSSLVLLIGVLMRGTRQLRTETEFG